MKTERLQLINSLSRPLKDDEYELLEQFTTLDREKCYSEISILGKRDNDIDQLMNWRYLNTTLNSTINCFKNCFEHSITEPIFKDYIKDDDCVYEVQRITKLIRVGTVGEFKDKIKEVK